MKTELCSGAEATIYLENNIISKTRHVKSYRHPQLDDELRKFRTRREAKILSELDIAPELINVDEEQMTIKMQFIEGCTVRELICKENAFELGEKIGKAIAHMHEQGIIHGDLTTSNLLAQDEKIWIIDFGLGFYDHHIEHKAVDLHVLKQACDATHPDLIIWEGVWKGYGLSTDLKERFEEVELRGRYKRKD